MKISEESPEVIIKGDCNDTTYAKKQLGTQPSETKILGLLWDKKETSIVIEIVSNKGKHTKHENLGKFMVATSIFHLFSRVSRVNFA